MAEAVSVASVTAPGFHQLNIAGKYVSLFTNFAGFDRFHTTFSCLKSDTKLLRVTFVAFLLFI